MLPRKLLVNYMVDACTFVTFLAAAISALVLFFALPGGPGMGTVEFLGIARRTWSDVHTWTGLACILFALLHVVLHFKMFWGLTKMLFAKRPSA